jgi:hypothetical protein
VVRDCGIRAASCISYEAEAKKFAPKRWALRRANGANSATGYLLRERRGPVLLLLRRREGGEAHKSSARSSAQGEVGCTR